MNKKRAQAWGFDLMVAVTLFTVGIISLYVYSINFPADNQEPLLSITENANTLADEIFSEGYPQYWTIENVVRPGIMSGNKVNQTKLEQFYQLSSLQYSRTKSLLRSNYDYYLYFPEPIMINGSEIDGIGRPETNPKNLIKVTRFIVYKDKTVTANLHVWN